MESTEVALPPCMLPSISEPVDMCVSSTTRDPTVISKPLCPWGKVNATETVSLAEVMSEQLASSLQAEEKKSVKSVMLSEEAASFTTENSDCSDDFVLAQMLQLEYDREHDTVLRQQEKKFNGDRKVCVSFGKYLRLPDRDVSDDDEDAENEAALELNAKTHWYNFEQAQKAFQAVGKSGVSRQGNTTTTKHDPTVCGRRNASKLMEFPPGIVTGDGGQFDMKLSNSVYNTLKLHSFTENKRSYRAFDKKDKSTAEKALDTKTKLILFKLINSQVLDALNGCISTGKEACVYHAWGIPDENQENPPEYAIKVFKTAINEFQNRDQYIREDHRFRDRFGKQNPRKIIHMWAEKEMRNLTRIKKAGIPCPDVVVLRDHVLVMTFIGGKMNPAPKLKHMKLPFEDMTMVYEQVFEIMKKMYQECKLVHADMSEYNLLWHEDLVWVIDVSQAVEITHPSAKEFLLRDCRNISNFFKKQDVLNVQEPEEMFSEICGPSTLSYK